MGLVKSNQSDSAYADWGTLAIWLVYMYSVVYKAEPHYQQNLFDSILFIYLPILDSVYLVHINFTLDGMVIENQNLLALGFCRKKKFSFWAGVTIYLPFSQLLSHRVWYTTLWVFGKTEISYFRLWIFFLLKFTAINRIRKEEDLHYGLSSGWMKRDPDWLDFCFCAFSYNPSALGFGF